MSWSEQSTSPKGSSDDQPEPGPDPKTVVDEHAEHVEVIRQADADLADIQDRVTRARARIAAANRKYLERQGKVKA
jgi:hypothetical protein